MRNIYLIAYDISDNKRRTRMHKKLKGYGEPLQYSLFRCALTLSERSRLRNELWPLMDHASDRVLLVNLGPDEGRAATAIEFWGDRLEDPAAHDGLLII
jgi:CRISPR-associated protein Cas2